MTETVTLGRKVAIAAPRGFAKSTLCSFLLPLWAICFNKRHFIILISNTHSQAVKFLHAIKTEFEVNESLKENFPDLKPSLDKWSEDELELTCGTERYKLLAIGSGAQLRGLKYLQYRPDLIVLDDIENDELVESEARRNDLQWWLDHVVLYTNPEAWIVMVGTILHEHALLNRIVRHLAPEDQRSYGDWQTQVFTALEARTSAWQEFLTTDRLHEMEARDPGGFQQELMNEPYAAGYQPFKPDYFADERWWTRLPEELSISITVDPACTDKEASDETAIVTAGWDAYGRLWVLDLLHGKFVDPSDTLSHIFSQYRKWQEEVERNPGWRFYCVGIEKNAFQRYLAILFNQLCRARGFRPYVKELKGDVRKVRRIWQLEPLFRENRIFLRHDMTALEVQLRSFRVDGKYAHDDLADALAYHLQLSSLLPQRLPAPISQADAYKLTWGEYMALSEQKHEYARRFPDLGMRLTPQGVKPWYWLGN